LTEETLKKVLRDFGLTDSEVEVYMVVSKRGVLSGPDVAHLIRKDKAQVFRTLRNLQTKGFVEATLEVPMRFAPVAFEKVLELTIKEKKDEAARIEATKEQLIDYWQDLNRKNIDVSLEKFVVIEGKHKIYSKLEQMLKETKSHLLAILTVPSLLRTDQSGLLDVASKRFSKSKLQLRFLTSLSEQEVKPMKALMKRRTKQKANFTGRVPDLGLRPFPRLIIRDEEELLFFLKSKTDVSTLEQDDFCLWTNSKEIVKAFTAVFENYWQNATEIAKKIDEIETGILSPETCVIKDAEEAAEKYEAALDSARQEIILLTSSEGLTKLSKNQASLKEKAEKGVSIRVLAPIIGENLEQALAMLKCCEVRHISSSYISTTIVDGQRLFQFKNTPASNKANANLGFENTFYTNDLEYVEKTRTMLNDIWKDAPVPSLRTIEYFEKMAAIPESLSVSTDDDVSKVMRKVSAYVIGEGYPVTEKSILDKTINAKKYVVRNPYEDITRLYGHSAQAVIHPPSFLNLPDLMIHTFHNDKQSSYGNEDTMIVYLWLNTPRGFLYVPTAVVGDVKEGQAGFEAVFSGTPAGQNVIIVRKDEIQVQMHGNTLFAGWTVPIPLLSSKYVLPPSAIFLEAYGNLKTKSFSVVLPSGFKITTEQNYLEAFVTFSNSASKYSGPGTEGVLSREMIMTTFPPEKR